MSLALSKVIATLIYPLGTSLLLAVVAGVLLLFKRRWLGGGLFLAALAWLWVWSMPATGTWLRGDLEQRFEMLPAQAAPEADAIIVLGGGITPGTPGWLYPDLSFAADRYWHAARLYHAGKAPRIVVSGGRVPWTGEGQTEAEAIAGFLVDLGVPRDALLLEDGSRSTRENAERTRRVLYENDIDTALLVTSALHMRRALASFRRLEMKVTPVAADFTVMPMPTNIMRFLPQAGALSANSGALHEVIGYWAYRLRGWA